MADDEMINAMMSADLPIFPTNFFGDLQWTHLFSPSSFVFPHAMHSQQLEAKNKKKLISGGQNTYLDDMS